MSQGNSESRSNSPLVDVVSIDSNEHGNVQLGLENLLSMRANVCLDKVHVPENHQTTSVAAAKDAASKIGASHEQWPSSRVRNASRKLKKRKVSESPSTALGTTIIIRNRNKCVDPLSNAVSPSDIHTAKNNTSCCLGEFICRLCTSKFDSSIALAQHQCPCIVHLTYPCTECEKTFSCPANLASHKRWHKPNASNSRSVSRTTNAPRTDRGGHASLQPLKRTTAIPEISPTFASQKRGRYLPAKTNCIYQTSMNVPSRQHQQQTGNFPVIKTTAFRPTGTDACAKLSQTSDCNSRPDAISLTSRLTEPSNNSTTNVESNLYHLAQWLRRQQFQLQSGWSSQNSLSATASWQNQQPLSALALAWSAAVAAAAAPLSWHPPGNGNTICQPTAVNAQTIGKNGLRETNSSGSAFAAIGGNCLYSLRKA